MLGERWLDAGAGTTPRPSEPSDFSRRWIRSVLLEGRLAFEREMARERRALEVEFDRFWRNKGSGRRSAPV